MRMRRGSTDQLGNSVPDWLACLTAPALYDVPVRSLAGPGEDAAEGDKSGGHLRNAPAGGIPTADRSNHNCLRLVLTRSKKITWYTDLFFRIPESVKGHPLHNFTPMPGVPRPENGRKLLIIGSFRRMRP